MNLCSLSCWTKRRKLLLVLAGLLNVAFFLIYDYRHSDRYKTLRKPSIHLAAFASTSSSSSAELVRDENGIIKGERVQSGGIGDINVITKGKISPYYKKRSAAFTNNVQNSFSGGSLSRELVEGARYGGVGSATIFFKVAGTARTVNKSSQGEITSAETAKLANETMATLLNQRRRPRPNMDMNIFLKSSGWLDRQVVHNNVYVYANVLDSPVVCPDTGYNLTLLVTVLTSVQNVAQRMAIRDTWGKALKKGGARIVFFLGSSSSSSIQTMVRREWKDHNDLVQEDFVDSYYNLSTKTISMLKWVSNNCNKVKYVLKTDDDIYVNAPALFQRLETFNDTIAIYGQLAHRWRPIRYKKSKWYVPFRNYPWAHYPDFVAGPAYFLTGSAVPRLFRVANRMKPFFLEDVFVTGLVAIVAGIPRIDQAGMKNSRDTFNPCSFNKTITSHSHPSWDLRRRHRAISSKKFICRINRLEAAKEGR